MATKKKEETFALIRGEGWFLVDREAGSDYDGKPWFIGVGAGFDILRLLVYAGNETDAEEIAEEEWPDRMGSKLSPEEAEEAEEEGRYVFYSDGDAYVSRETRIFAVAKRVEKGVPDKYGREAKLTTGETIEYK